MKKIIKTTPTDAITLREAVRATEGGRFILAEYYDGRLKFLKRDGCELMFDTAVGRKDISGRSSSLDEFVAKHERDTGSLAFFLFDSPAEVTDWLRNNPGVSL